MSRTPTFLSARLAALAHPDDRLLRDGLILDALGDTSPAVREVAVAWAARSLAPAALLPLMADQVDSVRRNAALAALERQGPFAVTAVAGLTGDADPDVAMFACQVLGGIGSREAAPALLGAMRRTEVNVVQAATEAVGRLKLEDAVPALVAMLQRESWLQLAAVDALGAIGSPVAVEPLLELVPDSFVAIPALDALRRIGNAGALPPLLALLLDPHQVHLRIALLHSLGGVLPEAVPSDLLTGAGRDIEADHAPDSVWAFLAARLTGEEDDAPPFPGTAGDDRSRTRGATAGQRAAGLLVLATGVHSLMSLVVRRAADPDCAAWIVPAARRFPASAAAACVALLTHPDGEVRAGAVRLMEPGAIGVTRLLELVNDQEAAVRLAAIDAVGVLGDPVVAPTLARYLENGTAPQAVAAARAFARLPEAVIAETLWARLDETAGDATVAAALTVLAEVRVAALDERVMRLAGVTGSPVRKAALRATSRIPGAAAEVLLFRALADRDASQQVEALELLVHRGGERVLTTLLAMLGIADSLRYHVIRALGRLGQPGAAPPLETLFRSAPMHEQLEILASMERLGNPGSRLFMAECLNHSDAEIRRAAAQGLSTLATADDLDLLHRLAGSPDWVLRGEAARAYGRLGLPEGRPPLLDLVRDLEPVVARTARVALGSCP
jgi:HEAT repeat protein